MEEEEEAIARVGEKGSVLRAQGFQYGDL